MYFIYGFLIYNFSKYLFLEHRIGYIQRIWIQDSWSGKKSSTSGKKNQLFQNSDQLVQEVVI